MSSKKLSAAAKRAREFTVNARVILESAEASTQAFRKAFDLVRKQRSAARGMTTDDEQDLLRAMVVFAGAGLDAALKQLIRDTIRELARRDVAVQRELEVFVARELRGDTDNPEAISGPKFLARILVASSPQNQVIEEYIRELTGSSLQSVDQLMRAAKALGVSQPAAGIEPRKLNHIFDVRNKIIHELDIDLNAQRRNRNIRGRDAMVEHTQTLLSVAQKVVEAVE